jgi:hypothetical protein
MKSLTDNAYKKFIEHLHKLYNRQMIQINSCTKQLIVLYKRKICSVQKN